MTTTKSEADRARAEANFKRKEAQKTEGQKATADYRAEGEAVRKNMAKLREQRLAREAGQHETVEPTKARQPAKKKR